MKMLIPALLCGLFLQLPTVSYADNDVPLPELCYDTVDGAQFCTTDNAGDVQVFIYNAGWCPPCNQEMSELSEAYEQFENAPVTFASLSGEGWQRGSQPNQTFLKEWKKRHGIPFVVAGKFRDFGKAFGASGSIPFSVVIDKDSKVVKKGFLSSSEIVSLVKRLLN